MSENIESGLHTQGVVSDYFTIEAHLLSTRSADGFKAIDRSRNASVFLWTLRHPLATNSDAVRRFLSRLQIIEKFSPPIAALSSYGVDSGGNAFAVFPALDGGPLEHTAQDVAEIERRYFSCLRFVDQLHKQDVVCGDLCASSFWRGRAGDMQFVGVMGSFDSEAAATAMMPPMETLHYIAPEQSAGGIGKSGDVFSLGVLGYYLFCGRYPYGDTPAALGGAVNSASIAPPTSVTHLAPAWADEVLLRALDPDPQKRYRSAGDFIQGMTDARQRISDTVSAPVAINSSPVLVTKGPEDGKAVQIHRSAPERQQRAPQRPSSFGLRWVVVGIAAIIFTILGVSSLIKLTVSEPDKLQEEYTHNQALDSNPRIRDAFGVVSGTNAELEEKAAKLKEISDSDDPLAHNVLVTTAKEAPSLSLRRVAERALADRSRRLGLRLTVEHVKNWLSGLRQQELPVIYEPVLRLLDTTMPFEARGDALREIYTTNRSLALRLAAALTLDAPAPSEYQPVLSQLVGDALAMRDANKRAALSLILSHPELSLSFGDDVIQKRDLIPDADVMWLVNTLSARGDLNVRAIASEGVERDLLGGLSKIFLQLMRDRNDIPSQVALAITKAAAGTLEKSDIATFGRWYDVDSEKLLLAVAAKTTDPDLGREVFDTLAGKSVVTEPSASLVDLVRKHYWESRTDFLPAIGTLAFLESVDKEVIKEALHKLRPHLEDQTLLRILMDSNSSFIVETILDDFPRYVSLGQQISLLSYPAPSVRIRAIGMLKGSNDVSILKIVIENYEKEKDKAVRSAYKDAFWVIREREDQGS